MSKRVLGFMNKSALVTYNTYIGGVSATISTDALLATKLGISVGRISNFTVVGSDIKCKITGSYAISASAFVNDIGYTYYTDNDGLSNSLLGFDVFKGCIDFKHGYFPAMTNIYGDNQFVNCGTIDYLYIPLVTQLGATVGNNNIFFGIGNHVWTIYCHPSLATNNGGLPDADIQAASAAGAQIRYVTNFTAPNHVTDLSSGTVYSTAVQLNFTHPTGSTNAIEYYECYVNDVLRNKITGSGQYITGLTASTNYDGAIKVVAVDIFLNKSVVSNSFNVSTNTTSAVPTTGLVSYYKLDETSGSIAVDSFGGKNLTNTGTTINQSGKISNSYLATTLGDKIQTTSATPITGNFSVNLWVYRTSSLSNYSGILDFGNYATNSGFSVWTDNGSYVGWRINQNYFNFSSSMYLPISKWKMITIVYNGTNVKMYNDSVLKKITAMTTNPNTTTLLKMFFNAENNSEFFGRIDEVPIYNTALTQTDIDLLYNCGTGITL